MLTYKIVVLGDFGVGKTSLVRRFVDNSFSEEYLSTIGVTMSRKQILNNNKTFSTMIIWDTEGKTEYNAIFQQYLKGAKSFIIVTDISKNQSLESLKRHVNICLKVMPNASIYIALNKSDLTPQIPYSLDDIKKLSENIQDVYKTSAKYGNAVDDIFNDINKLVIEDLS